MTEPSENPQFEPIHDAHAIEQVAIVLQFANPVASNDFQDIRKLADELKDEFPGKSPIQTFMVAVGAGGVVPAHPTQGFVLTDTSREGVITHELRLEHSSITYRTTMYTRWANIWGKANQYFNKFLPLYSLNSQLAAINLNYIDKFVWSGKSDEADPGMLLRANSKYLTPATYESKDLWHSHFGAFVKADPLTKRLVNVNVDFVDENNDFNARRVVSISTVLTDIYNQPTYKLLDLKTPEEISSFIDQKAQELHSYNKDVLGNIISDEMIKRISLEA